MTIKQISKFLQKVQQLPFFFSLQTAQSTLPLRGFNGTSSHIRPSLSNSFTVQMSYSSSSSIGCPSASITVLDGTLMLTEACHIRSIRNISGAKRAWIMTKWWLKHLPIKQVVNYVTPIGNLIGWKNPGLSLCVSVMNGCSTTWPKMCWSCGGSITG